MTIRRISSTAVVLLLVVPVCFVSIAWACAPSNWGWSEPGKPQETEVAPPAAGSEAQPAPPVQQTTDAAGSDTQATEQPAAQSPAEQTVRLPSVQTSPSRSTQPSERPATRPARGGVAAQGTSPVVAPARTGASSPAIAPAVERSAARSHTAAAKKTRHPADAPLRAKIDAAPVTSAPAAAVGRWNGPASEPSSGLVPSSDESAPSSASQDRLVFGAALLGFGLVGLFGGFAILEARRRRAVAYQDGASDRVRR